MTSQNTNPKGNITMQPLPEKQRFKVAIFSTLFVEAKDKAEAENIARDALIGCDIKTRDFDVDAEEWDD